MPDPSDTTTPSPPLRPLGSTADPIPTAPRSPPRRFSHGSSAPAPLRGPHNPRTPRPSLLSPAAMAAAIFPPQGTPGRGAGLRGWRARRGRGQREPARRRRVENSIGRGRGAGEAPPHDPARQGGKGGGFPGPPRVMQWGDQPREAVQPPRPLVLRAACGLQEPLVHHGIDAGSASLLLPCNVPLCPPWTPS